MKKISLLLLAALFSACNMSDYSEDLGNGYQFGHEGKNYNMIVGWHIIPCDVVAYEHDKNFILAAQVVSANCPLPLDSSLYDFKEPMHFWIISHKLNVVKGRSL